MKQEITKSMFINEFMQIEADQDFTYYGLCALYDHLEEIYDGNYNLNVIDLCCTYTEEKIEHACQRYNVNNLEELKNVIWNDEENVLYMQY